MKKTGNINFILLGARSTGKTVYLTSLYLHNKNIVAQNKECTDYFKPMAESLEKGEYPNATSGNLHEMYFNYKDENFTLSIQIDDVDGHFIETLSEEDEHTQSERNQFIENLKFSEGIIFFFPYQKKLDEKALGNFNAQIDTVIRIIKEIYPDRKKLPIPAVIAVSKWDESPNYKNEDEVKKAIEFIDNNKLMKLSKEKIETFFENIEIIPLSATGKDIKNLETYNIEKPIQFFLKETYDNWVKKITNLEKNEKEQLKFLSKIHFDIKLYDDSKYDKLYQKLEKKYSEELLNKLKKIQTSKEYKEFENRNYALIEALSDKHQKEITSFGKKLNTETRVKQLSITSIILIIVGIVIVSFLGWKAQSLLTKSETELFSTIELEYKTNNYEKALDNIDEYLNEYTANETVNLAHKNRIAEIKSSIKRKQIITEAKDIIDDSSFNNINKIEELLTLFSQKNIDEPKLKKELNIKKNMLLVKESYDEFKSDLEKKNFGDAIAFSERHWKSEFGKNSKIVVAEILNRKFNNEIEEKLKSISDIFDMSEYNNLVKKLDEITSLRNNNKIEKLDYKASINSDNQTNINRKMKVRKKYNDILNNGISYITVSFGARSKENEPLGFICGEEDEIILKIDTMVYHFDKSTSCEGLKISWKSLNRHFRASHYTVKVTEEDIADDDHYDTGSFSLNHNDLIKIQYGTTIKKDIGSGYFIELKR